MFAAGVLLAACVAIGQSPDAEPASPPAPAKGILPIPEYSGDLADRSVLTGDWGGTRSDLSAKGVQFEFNWYQYVQGVASGGRDNETRYGGKGEYKLALDLQQMGVLPGAIVNVRAESRYGESVNGISGSILPANTAAFFPLTQDADDGIPITITNLNITQYLGQKIAVFAGKIDTLDGDPNEFASGRGVRQFMNANLVFNSALALRVPYSTLGAGVVWLPAKGITVTSTVMNTADSSTTSGFDDFGDGGTWTTEADFQYRMGALPGGTLRRGRSEHQPRCVDRQHRAGRARRHPRPTRRHVWPRLLLRERRREPPHGHRRPPRPHAGLRGLLLDLNHPRRQPDPRRPGAPVAILGRGYKRARSTAPGSLVLNAPVIAAKWSMRRLEVWGEWAILEANSTRNPAERQGARGRRDAKSDEQQFPATEQPSADPDLARLVRQWADLPGAIRVGIVSMLNAVTYASASEAGGKHILEPRCSEAS